MLTAALPDVKFLLVDDLEENLFAFEQILRRDGLELVTVRSGREALEQLLVHEFALAIIDVQMPAMDGIELAELMRGSKRTQRVPIILVTAGSHERSRLFSGYEAGAVDYLYKPIEPVLLRNKAETFFELYRQKQQLARHLELLREGEEFRSRLFDATQDQMMVLDLEGRITWANAAAWRARAVDPIQGSLWVAQWCDEHRETALARLEEARCDRVSRFVGAVRAESGEVWLDVMLAPIHDARGTVDRLLAIGRDITEQRHTAAEREELTRQLEETLRLNELFLGAVGHDLRNPLSAIILGAERIVRRSRDAEAVRLAKTIQDGGKRMERMTDALFDLTRARLGGGIPIERAPLDLRPLAERVFAEHKLAAPSRDMTLGIAGNVEGEWDPTRFEQLLSNLLGNAVQHGTPEQVVEVEIVGEAPDEVVLEVRNGGTIPDQLMPELFDPFRRGDDEAGADGLGLGLFIVRQIVLAHGGRVEVESTEAQGTTFRVQIPRRPH
jgi:sigma-B regulation protein RsbU (phosphoserine phosphatase)